MCIRDSHILHIAEVVLQTGCDLNELIVHLRHLILQVADGRRSANACPNVLAPVSYTHLLPKDSLKSTLRE